MPNDLTLRFQPAPMSSAPLYPCRDESEDDLWDEDDDDDFWYDDDGEFEDDDNDDTF